MSRIKSILLNSKITDRIGMFFSSMFVFTIIYLYIQYKIEDPVPEVNGQFYLFWAGRDASYHKARDYKRIKYRLAGERNRIIFAFDPPATMSKIRMDPSPGNSIYATLYQVLVKDENRMIVINADTTELKSKWECVHCRTEPDNEGWKLSSSGGLAIASPSFPSVAVENIIVDIKVRTSRNISFLSWLFPT